VVEKTDIISGADIKTGDVVIGLASNGAHSNGYSLVRKIISTHKVDLKQKLDGKPLADLIMAPTRIYVKPMLALMKTLTVKGMAHITGGGLLENVPRVLPENVVAQLDGKSWHTPALFDWLQKMGNVASQEMYRTFNCGVGMVVIVAKHDADEVLKQLNASGETATVIGVIRARQGAEHQTQVGA
jgi:phosphoribosylformylglycinamidine cyclo-ligase